jgi:DNA-binding transcriptional LysR family regulator
MQIDAIRLFCDVALHRSISRAAELYGVTQSAASQRLMALEKELGVVLVDRSTRPLQLTAAGDVFHRGCRKIIQQYEQLKQQVTGSADGFDELRGEVTIAAIYSAGIDLMNQVIAGWEAAHPRAHVRITYLQPDDVYEGVRQEQYDLGILSYPERWRGLASIPLRQELMAVVVRAGHELAGREAMEACELVHHDMVMFEPSLPIARRIRHYLREQCGGELPHEVSQFDNIDTIKTFIAEADAVAILPQRTVAREVQAGVLAAVTLWPRLVRPLGIVHSRQREQSGVVRSFIEYLLKNQPKQLEHPASAAASR